MEACTIVIRELTRDQLARALHAACPVGTGVRHGFLKTDLRIVVWFIFRGSNHRLMFYFPRPLRFAFGRFWLRCGLWWLWRHASIHPEDETGIEAWG
jgi:hypothetical protein